MKLDILAGHPDILRSKLIEPQADLSALHCDSRRVDSQTGFFALKGLAMDGHQFIPETLALGCPVVFVSDAGEFNRLRAAPPRGLKGVFLVSAGRRALAEISDAVYGSPSSDLTLLGVTGTNGKTTVIHLCLDLLGAASSGAGAPPAALLGTLGWRIGNEQHAGNHTTPEAPDIQAFLRRCKERGVSTVAMEVSSHGIDLERTHGLRFQAAAFTNLSQDHLDYHRTMEQYRDTKFRLFLEYAPLHALINLDDPAGVLLMARLQRERPQIRCIGYGLSAVDNTPGLRVSALQPISGGWRGLLCWEGAEADFSLPLPGRFNVENFLAATGLLLASGVALEALAAAATACRGAPGRFERVDLGVGFTVVVDYAHTPHALENLLQTARSLGAGPLTVLFGCGGERDREKRPRMGAIAEKFADKVVLCDDNPRREESAAILAEIAAGMGQRLSPQIIPDRREAIFEVLDGARPGEIVLLAGKGSEPYQDIGGVKHPFDDRQVAREWAVARGKISPTKP